MSERLEFNTEPLRDAIVDFGRVSSNVVGLWYLVTAIFSRMLLTIITPRVAKSFDCAA